MKREPLNSVSDISNFAVDRLGACRYKNPMKDTVFVADDIRILYENDPKKMSASFAKKDEFRSFECAGPREKIFFNPRSLNAGIVTCGGLCPGINAVIRALYLSLHHHYGVRNVYGFRYGYEGLVAEHGHKPLLLTPETVKGTHEQGGTILGSSRGNQDTKKIVRTLVKMDIGILFVIGGDGTLRGGRAIADEIKRQGLLKSVIGVPKTIDNDIMCIQSSFGFETAGSEARRAIQAAYVEATGARNGVGLVKLMGRDSGWIAAYATIASSGVNFCLVPEVRFSAEGFLKALEARLDARNYAVVVVAEGAGQDLVIKDGSKDASGNVRYGDIGTYLRELIREHFAARKKELNLKYIDPSYMIRSVPANARDSGFCLILGHNAVHAGMSGRTNMVVGNWHGEGTHVPISLATSGRKKIDPHGWLWSSVLSSTGQGSLL